MTRFGTKLGAIAAVLLLLPWFSAAGTEEICGLKLKPVHCICGTVINVAGEPVVGATITIFSNGSEAATVKTDESGKFSLDQLQAGSYQVAIQAHDFRSFQFPVALVEPHSKPKRALEIVLTTGYPENCTRVN